MMMLIDEAVVEAHLQERCWFWQRILQLQDWHIHVRVVPHHHPKLNDGVAASEIYPERRDAIIRMVRPADLPSIAHDFLDGEERDYDLSLVHELLHIHLSGLNIANDSPASVAEEQAINAISRGLITLARTKGGEELPTHPMPGVYLTMPIPPRPKPEVDVGSEPPLAEELPTKPPQAMVNGYF
jgi:hypothetical protein